MLKRSKYLDKIRPFYDVDLMKVLIGLRRSGKSILLDQIKNELIEKGIQESNIIYLNFESVKYSHLNDYRKLANYIDKFIVNKDKYYLFFDEIQMVEGFERAINSFKVDYNCSIFITGSNSNLLAGELATLLSGRYVKFKIAPFSFKEMIEYKNISKEKYSEAFNEFLNWGSMPQRFVLDSETAIKTYLKDVYDSIIIHDIQKRASITDVDLLNRVLTYMIQNTAQTFSATSIEKYLLSEKINIANKTLYKYIEAILNSNILNKVSRYDIKGKKVLKREEKYYVADLGLRKINLKSANIDLGDSLETVVYNELIARGYEVFIGKTYKGEVDFIATKDGDKVYLQVAYLLATKETVAREFNAFKDIEDNYSKFVISMDEFDFSRDGIKHLNVIDFLLNEELLK
jgi:uncharacterized protein